MAITKVLLWPTRLKNVFAGTQDCVQVVDISDDDGDAGPCLAVLRDMDDARKVAAVLAPGAEIVTE